MYNYEIHLILQVVKNYLKSHSKLLMIRTQLSHTILLVFILISIISDKL